MIIRGDFLFSLLLGGVKINETFQILRAYTKLTMQIISVFYQVQLQNRYVTKAAVKLVKYWISHT